MPYNVVDDIFYTKKVCSRLSSNEVRFYMVNGRFAFLSPPPFVGLIGNIQCSS